MPGAANVIHVSVEGPASLIALDNGDHFTDGMFNVAEKSMRDGFALAILRAGRKTGAVRAAFSADGLSSEVADLVAK